MSEILQERLLAELRAARRHRVRHGWLRHVVKGLEDDPAVQERVHKWACVFWLANMVGATLVFFFAPRVWAEASIFYVVFISLYANLATDYGALSAAQASLHVSRAEGAPVAPEPAQTKEIT